MESHECTNRFDTVSHHSSLQLSLFSRVFHTLVTHKLCSPENYHVTLLCEGKLRIPTGVTLVRFCLFNSDFKFDGFSLESCRSMVALLDVSAFKIMLIVELRFSAESCLDWIAERPVRQTRCGGVQNAVEVHVAVQGGHVQVWHRQDWHSEFHGTGECNLFNWIGSQNWVVGFFWKLSPCEHCLQREALKALGFTVSNRTFNCLVLRYSDKRGTITFDDFVLICVRLRTCIESFKAQTNNGQGNASFPLDQFIQTLLYVWGTRKHLHKVNGQHGKQERSEFLAAASCNVSFLCSALWIYIRFAHIPFDIVMLGQLSFTFYTTFNVVHIRSSFSSDELHTTSTVLYSTPEMLALMVAIIPELLEHSHVEICWRRNQSVARIQQLWSEWYCLISHVWCTHVFSVQLNVNEHIDFANCDWNAR